MPAPAAIYIIGAVGVIAAVVAFKEFVFEPHIAPKIEVWAESFIERRRRQRQQRNGPALASPVNGDGNANRARRPVNPTSDRGSTTPSDEISVELDQISVQRHTGRSDRQNGLRLRQTTVVMEESNVFIPFTPISPTREIVDSSAPSSPHSLSQPDGPPPAEKPSVYRSSPAATQPPQRRGMSPRNSMHVDSPRLPTPLSLSAASSRAGTPSLARSKLVHPSPSSRASSPDVPAMYDTALMDSVDTIAVERTPLGDVRSFPTSRIQSPFSDAYSVVAHSPTLSARSDAPSYALRLEEEESELDMLSDTDTDEDILSLRSDIFSPEQVGHRPLTFDVESLHGSDTETESWASTGRRTPEM